MPLEIGRVRPDGANAAGQRRIFRPYARVKRNAI
jgi:hypothetical protein